MRSIEIDIISYLISWLVGYLVVKQLTQTPFESLFELLIYRPCKSTFSFLIPLPEARSYCKLSGTSLWVCVDAIVAKLFVQDKSIDYEDYNHSMIGDALDNWSSRKVTQPTKEHLLDGCQCAILLGEGFIPTCNYRGETCRDCPVVLDQGHVTAKNIEQLLRQGINVGRV